MRLAAKDMMIQVFFQAREESDYVDPDLLAFSLKWWNEVFNASEGKLQIPILNNRIMFGPSQLIVIWESENNYISIDILPINQVSVEYDKDSDIEFVIEFYASESGTTKFDETFFSIEEFINSKDFRFFIKECSSK